MARLFKSKKTMNMVLLAVAVVAVLYFLLNAREGFQGGEVREVMFRRTSPSYTVPREMIPAGKALKGIDVFVYGKCLNPSQGDTWVHINNPASKNMRGFAGGFLTPGAISGNRSISVWMNGSNQQNIKAQMASPAGVPASMFSNSLEFQGLEGARLGQFNNNCGEVDKNGHNVKINLRFM
jgi:hypothetical protein